MKRLVSPGQGRFPNIMWRAALLLLLVLAVAPVAASRESARHKACAANQRVLVGAIEMYNMDKPAPLKVINPSTLSMLVKEQYLKSPLTPPDPGCSYSGKDLDKDLSNPDSLHEKISCAFHGRLSDIQKLSEEIQQAAKMKQVVIVGTVALALLIILAFIFADRVRSTPETTGTTS